MAGAASLAFSPDGKYLATGGAPDYKSRDGDFHIRLWDLQTGKLKTLFPPVNGSPITKLIFTSDSATLISAGLGQQVTAWKSPSGERIREFPTDEESYHSVALSPDEKWVAASGNDSKTAVVFSLDGSHKLCQIRSKRSYFYNFEFSPDNKALLTYEHDRLCFWDITTGKPRSTIPFEGAASHNFYLAPDGKKIAYDGNDNDIHWLDALTGKPFDSWKGCSAPLSALTFSRDGKLVVTGDWGVVRVWDASTAKVIRQPQGFRKICYGLCCSADGKTVLAANHETLYFLEGQTLRERVSVPIAMDVNHYPNYRISVVLSPDGNVAACLGKNDEILLADSREPKLVRTFRRPDWVAASLAFSADGKHLYATGHKSVGLRIWHVQTGKEVEPLDKTLAPLTNLTLAHQAERLAVVVKGAKPLCRIWDLRLGKEETALELNTGPVRYGPDEIQLSQDGKLLLAYHVNSHVSIWDLAKKVERHRFMHSFEDGPFRWAFSSDSKLLVTTHAEGTFRSWDMTTGKKVAELRGHPESIVACSADGSLISTCTSCTVLRWQKSAWQGK
jgi:WD40 repeat protein